MQNDRLNRGYCLLIYVLPIFAPLQPSKIMFAAVCSICVCARTVYIGKTSKSVLFDVCGLFLSGYYMLVLSFVFCTLAAVFFRFRLHSLFVPWNLCVKHYASFCIFMQSKNVYLYNIMINRKLWGIFEFSLAHLRKRPIFLLFVFSIFLLFWINYRKQKQKRKRLIFAVFAWKRPFLSQIKCLFSVIYDYIGQITPHPPTFGTRRVGQLSSKNFLFFIFYFL